MKRHTPLRTRTSLRRSSDSLVRSRMRRKRRPAAETLRIYGPPERRRWVKALPCVVCGASPCDNAHAITGGKGRKADACWILPLCSRHCARRQTDQGWAAIGLTREQAIRHAVRTELAWQALEIETGQETRT